jgi:hypothetical protein
MVPNSQQAPLQRAESNSLQRQEVQLPLVIHFNLFTSGNIKYINYKTHTYAKKLAYSRSSSPFYRQHGPIWYSSQQSDSNVRVTYGSLVKITNPASRLMYI